MDLEDQQEESSDISDETKVDQESAINLINAIDPKHREHLCQVWSLELPLPNKLVDGKLENVLLPSRYYGSEAVCIVRVCSIDQDDTLKMHILIQKAFTDDELNLSSVWDIQHVVECTNAGLYKATCDLFLHSTSDACSDSPHVSIHMNRSTECSLPIQSSSSTHHVVNVGKIVEQVESKLRSELVDFYGKRVQDFCMDVRTSGGDAMNVREQREQLAAELCEKLY